MEPKITNKTDQELREEEKEDLFMAVREFRKNNTRLIKQQKQNFDFKRPEGVVKIEGLYHTKPFLRFIIQKIERRNGEENEKSDEKGGDLQFDEKARTPGEILDKVKEGQASTRDHKESLKKKGIIAWNSPYLIHQGEKFRSYDALDRFIQGGAQAE